MHNFLIRLSDFIWIIGWYVGPAMFAIQLRAMYQESTKPRISWVSHLGIGLLNANSVIHLYRCMDYWSAFGAGLLSFFCLAIAYRAFSIRKGDLPALSKETDQPTSKKKPFAYAAVIFDLDGTLFDTQTPVHATIEAQILGRHGIVADPVELSRRFAGRPTRDVFKELAPHLDADKLYNEKWEAISHYLDTHDPEPISGMDQFLSVISLMNIPMAIASASPRWYIERMVGKKIGVNGDKDAGFKFRHTPLSKYIGNRYVSAEEVERPKPAPDVFLKAAEILSADPSQCLVIGDGKSDVFGGLQAGMDVWFLGESDHEIEFLKNVTIFADGNTLFATALEKYNH